MCSCVPQKKAWHNELKEVERQIDFHRLFVNLAFLCVSHKVVGLHLCKVWYLCVFCVKVYYSLDRVQNNIARNENTD